MYRIIDNPQACVNGCKRAGKTCKECYFSQVKGNTWQGNEACFNVGCLKAATNSLHKSL